MKTGLNINLSQMSGSIAVAMKIGLFGKQLIPSAIAMFVFWPILIPQIYGLVQQSKLDTEAYNVIEAAIRERENFAASIPENTDFCVFCGTPIPKDSSFCISCGKRVAEEVSTCTKCGAELSAGTVFCHKCGTQVS